MNVSVRKKGLRIFLAGLVELEGVRLPRLYFIVLKKYRCIYNIERWKFSRCECVHGSLWGVNKDEMCKHEWAVKYFIRAKWQEIIGKGQILKEG